MELLEILKAWIMGFPQWGEAELRIDTTDAEPVSCGLFPLGCEELSRKEDVLGNVRQRLRQTFALRRVAQRQEAAAAWLLEFAQWVRLQSPPHIGENTRIRAEKGRLLSVTQTGTATYEVKIILEYDKEI